MSDFDLASLQAAAASDARPSASAPDEIPTETSPADQAVAGYAMAVNLVTRAGYERIFELMDPLRADLTQLAEAPTTLRRAGISRTKILERMAATVDEINALTQRLIDQYRPGDSVYEFLSARTLDTTVPPY
ncbi:MAG TPA: hypothetical protein VEI45_25835 [Mycobacterium sp.]|uniref:hypothetical protein n=1 Tax=Mycobacterium sp. TaxID=1785 RepID=UPI002D60AEC6|nr:hypothetical protein [Mycobacterium sp.]HXY67700.1 hypothetical protein [Mycobacterium sp.]